MPPLLNSARRSALRAEAHKLTPVVIIGDKGLTDEVIAEIDRSLRAHELIKVRAASGARDVREIWLDTICERLEAHAVQMIGKVFVIYRENPEENPKGKSGAGPSSREAPGGQEKQRRESSATAKARVVSEQARAKQRARDDKKRRERDARDMARKGKFGPGPSPRSGARGDERTTGVRGDERTTGVRGDERTTSARGDERATGAAEIKRTSRPRSRTPSSLPESEPRRRRPRTSR